MIIAFNYIAICLASMAGVTLFGAPRLAWLVPAATLAVAIVGVPHGGLDHWTGRRLLTPRFAHRWWLMFFPTYLLTALIVACAWVAFPVVTIVLFFIASAWHFGREDDKARPSRPTSMVQSLSTHLNAIALGGLAIWVPALLRPEEMQKLLGLIVHSNDFTAPEQIVVCTQWLACALVPWAAVVFAMRIFEDHSELGNWVPLATSLLAATTPILLAFSVYFCAWHSVQGLLNLQRQERLSHARFMFSILPLSTTAIIGIALVGFCFSDVTESMAGGIIPATLRTLFIGLAAIAVPHLLVHESAEWLASSQASRGVSI